MKKEELWKQHFRSFRRTDGNSEIIWYNVEVPCSLEEVLQTMHKTKLVDIFKHFGFSGGNHLKKAELVDRLAKILPLNRRWLISRLEQGIYDFLMDVANQGGIILADDFSYYEVNSFLENGFLFPCQNNGIKFLYMPDEILDAIQALDKTECQKKVEKSTEIVQLCNGLLYYYGVMDIWFLAEKLEHYRNEKVEMNELNLILSVNSHFRSLHWTQDDIYAYFFLDDIRKVADERRALRNIDYKYVTKEQLLAPDVPHYYIDTKEREKLIAFLKDTYTIDEEGIRNVQEEIMLQLHLGVKPKIILGELEGTFELISDVKKILHNRIIDLYNVTHQWRLKGHTPRELSMEEEKQAIVYTSRAFTDTSKPSNNHVPSMIAPVASNQTKVGRNDPCYCGSGKKYKRCCGAS